MKSKLSIIIVNFNTQTYLEQCLESLVREYRSELVEGMYEVIVVDNHSAQSPKEMLSARFPFVQLLQLPDNMGFAKANNRGIAQAKGEYVLLLNPDTVVGKNVLPRMLTVMQEHEDTGIVTCRVNLVSGQIDDACHRGFPTPWRALCQFSGLSKLFAHSTVFNGYHLGYRQMDTMHEIDACAGAFMMIRRKVGEQVQWLDEDYFWYGEDLDLCYRVKLKGWKILFVPDVAITHYKGVASGIKKHSQAVSVADKETRLLATKARFDVMRIFYEKHYQNKYPRWMKQLVLWGIEIKYLIAKTMI